MHRGRVDKPSTLRTGAWPSHGRVLVVGHARRVRGPSSEGGQAPYTPLAGYTSSPRIHMVCEYMEHVCKVT